MAKSLALGKISELVGYKGRTQVFRDWIKAGHTARVDAIKIGAEFMSRGYDLEKAIELLNINKELFQELKAKTAELKVLEKAVNDYADKMEQLKGIGKRKIS